MHAASLFCPSTDDLLARVVCNSAREQIAQPTDALPVVKSPGGRWRAASREGCAAAFSTRGANAMEGTLANLIVQLIAGAIGGTAAGSALKDLSMGKSWRCHQRRGWWRHRRTDPGSGTEFAGGSGRGAGH